MVKNENTEIESHDARSRLILSALRLFAEKGFEAATTREICEAAGANISAIRYYFGDKAGLYSAVFTEPMGEKKRHTNIATYLDLPLAEALGRFFAEFLEPLKKGEQIRLVMKLHFREMIEPTEIRQQEIDAEIRPQHDALVAIRPSGPAAHRRGYPSAGFLHHRHGRVFLCRAGGRFGHFAASAEYLQSDRWAGGASGRLRHIDDRRRGPAPHTRGRA